MSEKRFAELLSESGLSKAELARRLGLDATTPSKWKPGEEPQYATAYLRLYCEVKRLSESIL